MNTNFKIFLVQPTGYAELDVEGLDFNTTFSITDISDISSRKDTISKNITLKATANNNRIFGNLYDLNRYTDEELPEQLYYNYIPNKEVEALVYEDGTLLFRGTLRIYEIVLNPDGTITYQAIITGLLKGFYNRLGDKFLTDLSFSGLTHTYTVNNIFNSWSNNNQTYLYPFVDYGDKTNVTGTDVNKVHVTNFRPAIYVKEYLKQIFNQPDLSGYTFTITGDTSFIGDFDKLIILNDEQSFNQVSQGSYLMTFTKSSNTTNGGARIVPSDGQLYRAVKFNTLSNALNLVTPNTTNYFGETNNIFKWNRDVTSDIEISLNVSFSNSNVRPINAFFRFQERNVGITGSEYDSQYNWNTITESFIGVVAGGGGTINKTHTFTIPSREYQIGKEFSLILFCQGENVDLLSQSFPFTIGAGTLKTPSEATNKATYSVELGDTVTPSPISGVKQKEFINSLTKLFNLYVDADTENPKHFIFQPYDFYYRLTQQNILASSGISWTDKIDYNKGLTVKPVTDISKKYTFNYKEDNDYLNELYKNKYGEVYGNYTLTDNGGFNDEKKIELLFASTPVAAVNDTGRIYPLIHKLDSGNRKIGYKSKPRILFYNGTANCLPYQIGRMSYTGDTYSFTPQPPIPFTDSFKFTIYPNVSHLRYDMFNNPASDLNFGAAREYFLNSNINIFELPNSFTKFYGKQIDEMSDANIRIIECDAILNNLDIANLDFKVPIYIDTKYGSGYYKLLSVDYSSSNEPASIKVQRIKIV
jgi:hypothetical protein